MEPKIYIINRIEGEYAYLQEAETGSEVFIALALLPEGVDEGTRLRYEMFAYTIEE